MRDITDLMDRYREASRHLWNSYFVTPDIDSKRVEEFDKIRFLLFRELVLEPLGNVADDSIRRLGLDHFLLQPVSALDFIRVVPSTISVPIEINQGAGQSGYWDAEPKQVERDAADLVYVDCFDWDVRSFREFQYYLVQISRFANYQHVERRFALTSVAHCRVFVMDRTTSMPISVFAD